MVQARNRAVVESYTTNGGPTSSCAQCCYCFIVDLRTRCMSAGLLGPDVTPTTWFCSAAP